MEYRRTRDEQVHQLFTPPIALDAGKLAPAQAAAGYGLAALLFLVALLCALVVVACFPSLPYGDGAGYRMVGAGFSALLALLALRSAWGIWHSVDRGFRCYDAFLDEVRQTWLDAVDEVRGNPAYTAHEEEAFTLSFPHILTAALSVTWETQRRDCPTRPWSVESLMGKACLTIPDEQGSGERYIHYAHLSKGRAEELGRTFARLGLIEGRQPRSAGSWVPQNIAETFYLVTANWEKAGLPLA